MLSELFVNGKLRPREQAGRGRTPVREALLRLQNKGIICNSRHNYRVRILTRGDIKEIYETLGILEGAVAGAVP